MLVLHARRITAADYITDGMVTTLEAEAEAEDVEAHEWSAGNCRKKKGS
jgi:hypothetical protein